ncbi:10312_t:CDS:1, partial [Dentiscutata erythropus]
NCLDYDKDVVFLRDEFFCKELIHAFDLETTFLQNFNPDVINNDMMSRGGTPFDRAYMNVSVYIQGNDPTPLGVICLMDVSNDTPLRYESDEEISNRIWKMVNDITKFQKVNPKTVKAMVNFTGKTYREMIKDEHMVIHQLIDEMDEPVKFPITVIRVEGECDFYRAFAKMQYNICPHVMIGHNSNGFDMPFIMRRLEYLGAEMMEEFYQIATGKRMSYGEMFKYKVIRSENITIAQSENSDDFIYIKFDGTLFWDSMTIFRRDFPGKQSSLNYMLDTLEIPSKVGLSYKRISEIVQLAIRNHEIENQISKLDSNSIDFQDCKEQLENKKRDLFQNETELEKLCTDILEYCFYDSWAVLLSIVKMQKLVSYRLDGMIYNCEYAQPFRGGKTSMLNCLIAKNYNKSCYDKPVSYGIKEKKEKFQGANVLDPQTGYYMDPVYTIDFSGLYPSIMREYNMGPDTLRYEKPNEKHYTIPLVDNNTGVEQEVYFIHEEVQESILRNILTDLIKKRKESKKERDKYAGVDDIMYGILEQKQLAYKSSANALYGGLGSEYLGITTPMIS